MRRLALPILLAASLPAAAGASTGRAAVPPADPPSSSAGEALDAEAEELRELEEAEEKLRTGAGQVLRQLEQRGPGSFWAELLSAPLGLGTSEWPAAIEDGGHAALPGGELPFSLDAVRAGYDIPLDYNAEVASYLAFFQGPGRKWFTRWLSRSHRYVPMFREILREHGVPEDLVYLAMIESGFSTHAYSRAHASGPWQFIASTGRRYGLRDDFWVDERRDFVKATHAAARFLKALHGIWGDWYLAWAGYNAGPGRVKRAIESHGTRDFWALHDAPGAFRKETQGYVPKLIAAALIARHPERFGFTGIEPLPPLEWEEVEVPAATDLEIVARCAGATLAEIQELNPELRRWATPPTSGTPYVLRVPKGRAAGFAEAYAKVKPSERFTFRAYVVQRGDTLGHIARTFGTSVEAVKHANRITDPRRLRPGQQIVIPTPPGARGGGPVRVASAAPRPAPVPGTTDGDHHVLGEGETLGHLAERYGTTIDQLERWNGIRNPRRLQIGQRLRVR